MKKLLAVLLSALLVLTLAACGGNTDDPEKTTAPAGDDTPVAQGNGEVKTNLFTLKYDDSVWKHIEDDMTNDEEYCYANLQVLDPDDPEYYLIDVEIEVSVDSPYDFREDLVYYGFDQYEYKVNNKYDTVDIGGAKLLKYDDGDDTVLYFNRVEGAGATISVKFDTTDVSDSRIEALVKGLTFNLEDTGNVDGPWEWEGEAFSTEDHTVTAGSLTLKSEFIPFEKYISTFEIFNHSIAAVGDRIYVLCDGELMECSFDGEVLAFVNPVELPEDDYEIMSTTSDGSLWLSGSMNDILRLKDGKVVNTYEDIDKLVMHPSGEWGVDYFTGSECNIVTFSGDTFSAEPIVFEEVNTIMHVSVDENNIYVCASAADDSGHKVFVYGKDGTLKTTLCDADGEGLGSVTFVTATENGYIGFDGNMRDVLLWDNAGAFVAEISSDELFDTHYPWFCASTVLSDGSILTIMTEERADRSATELLVFKVSGF